MKRVRVPIKLDGKEVGYAILNDDNIIEGTITDAELSKKLMGSYNHFSIASDDG